MEIGRNHDERFSETHGESSLARLEEIHALLLQSLQQAELELLLQELDDLIESEGGVLIP